MMPTALGSQSMPGRRPRLLLVDDQPANIQALHRVFASDCQVLMATTTASSSDASRKPVVRRTPMRMFEIFMSPQLDPVVVQPMQAAWRGSVPLKLLG